VAALVGLWLFDRERRWSGLPDQALDAAMAGIIGGLAGAKLVWAVEHAGRQGPFLDLLLSRGGLSWFGGFASGLAAGLVLLHRRRIPIVPVLAAAAPALAIAHAIGRVGCFLVGDDYGDQPRAPDAALRDDRAPADRMGAAPLAAPGKA
jgi:phosphatidylglycerol:prolipoprotein diacylglycerol transferase